MVLALSPLSRANGKLVSLIAVLTSVSPESSSSVAIALFVQLPVRSLQAERFVRPHYVSFRYLMSLPASFVLLDAKTVWPAADLMRNDPFLQRSPKLLFSSRTTPQQIETVKKLGSLQEIGGETLVKFGLPMVNLKE